MRKPKEILKILNHHLISQFDEKTFLDESFKSIKVNDFTITYKGSSGFISAKTRGFKFKSVLIDGVIIEMTELRKIGLCFYDEMPFGNEILDIQCKLRVYTDMINRHLHLSKIYIYFPFVGDKLHYLLMFDTGDNFLFVSDVPEMSTNPVEFAKHKTCDDFYNFLHVGDNFQQNIEDHFFKKYQKYMQDPVTRDDFLVAIMETI